MDTFFSLFLKNALFGPDYTLYRPWPTTLQPSLWDELNAQLFGECHSARVISISDITYWLKRQEQHFSYTYDKNKS